jgi:hypothetical protein
MLARYLLFHQSFITNFIYYSTNNVHIQKDEMKKTSKFFIGNVTQENRFSINSSLFITPHEGILTSRFRIIHLPICMLGTWKPLEGKFME